MSFGLSVVLVFLAVGVFVGIFALLLRDSIRIVKAPWAREEDRRIAEAANAKAKALATNKDNALGNLALDYVVFLLWIALFAAVVIVALAVFKWAWGVLTT